MNNSLYEPSYSYTECNMPVFNPGYNYLPNNPKSIVPAFLDPIITTINAMIDKIFSKIPLVGIIYSIISKIISLILSIFPNFVSETFRDLDLFACLLYMTIPRFNP